MSYQCRYGRSRKKQPATSYEQLLRSPTRVGPDDGTVELSATLEENGGQPACRDCKRGKLVWAEAAYVPWHRICDICGSHWDLHPLQFGVLLEHGGFMRWVDGRGRIPLERGQTIAESGKTWGDLLDLITPTMWTGAAEPERVLRTANLVAVGGAWARRARFYA
jgi:hypothetical protein